MKPQVIAQKVAEQMGISFEEVRGPSRIAHIVECRRMIAFMLHERQFTVPQICEILQRERTTILYQLEVMKSNFVIYPKTKKQYQELTRLIHETQTD
jgi:chromosomal replication initiation ATPase DnaA